MKQNSPLLLQIPDSFQDFFRELSGGTAARPTLLTHCRRELMHAVWQHLLDEDFVAAYTSGIIIHCADGVSRHIFPRLFTYSADYPEKCVFIQSQSALLTSLANLSPRVLLASVRDKGHRPCPCCKITKAQVADIRTHNDTRRRLKHSHQDNHAQRHKIASARSFIYKKGLGITSKAVEALLKEFTCAHRCEYDHWTAPESRCLDQSHGRMPFQIASPQ